jgi:hypothetical protein
MKHLLTAFALATLTSTSIRPAHAQDAVSFGLMVGGEEVGGAFRDGHSFQHGVAGVVVGALALFPLSSPRLSLRADVMYHQLDLGACPNLCGSEQTFSRIVSGSFSVVARLNDRRAPISPYVLAGIAGYATSFADGNIVAMHPGHIAFAGGIGLEARVRKATFFAELRYMAMPPGAIEPLTIGMRF